MLERGTRTKPTDQRFIVGIGLIAAIAIAAVALLLTPFERHFARNDPRVGTTTQTSQKNPGSAPTTSVTGNGG